tara:strand:- start:39 stop:200 length:162 start_codon:yes stop_codon:yes gene_type:complete
MEDILEKILVQLTRIADCYENKEKREINEARNKTKRVKGKRTISNKNLKKAVK